MHPQTVVCNAWRDAVDPYRVQRSSWQGFGGGQSVRMEVGRNAEAKFARAAGRPSCMAEASGRGKARHEWRDYRSRTARRFESATMGPFQGAMGLWAAVLSVKKGWGGVRWCCCIAPPPCLSVTPPWQAVNNSRLEPLRGFEAGNGPGDPENHWQECPLIGLGREPDSSGQAGTRTTTAGRNRARRRPLGWIGSPGSAGRRTGGLF